VWSGLIPGLHACDQQNDSAGMATDFSRFSQV